MIEMRPATIEDVPLLTMLMGEFYDESAFPLDEARAAGSFAALLGDDRKGAVWIGSVGGKPAGYVVLTVRHSMEFGGADGFIDDLFVRPAYRRRGLARALLDVLLDACNRRHLKALHVAAAREPTPARSLYERFAFRAQDRRQEFLTLPLSSSPQQTSPAQDTGLDQDPASCGPRTRKGTCACGSVHVEAKGEPYRIGVCHCLTCRKAHGAPFNFYAVFPPEAVSVGGEVITFASSPKVRRYSCARCGAPIYSTYGREDEFYLHPGSFDDIGAFAPTYELWMRRREPWLPVFPTTVCHFAENRPRWQRHEPEQGCS